MINHLHVHVVPRTRGDFVNNDEIYTKLEKFDEKYKYLDLFDDIYSFLKTLAEANTTN